MSEVPNAIAYPIIGAVAFAVVLFVGHEMRGRTPAAQGQAQAELVKTPPRRAEIETRPTFIPDDEYQIATRAFDRATEDAMSSATECTRHIGDTAAWGRCMNEATRASSRQSAAMIDVEKACAAKTQASVRRMLGVQ